MQKNGSASLTLQAKQKDTHLEIPYAPVTLTIAVEGASPLVVKPPAKWIASEVWSVVAKGPARDTPLAGNRTRWEQTLLIDPLASGEQDLQVEPLEYQEKSGAWQTIRWQPIKLLVRPRLTEADAGQLRDITSIENLPPAPPGWDGWPWLAGAMVIAATVLMAAWLWRRRRIRAESLTPDEWARRELDRLLALRLPERGQGRRFHTLLSNALRHYLERRFAMPARRQTTPEFFDMVSKDDQFTPEQRSLLRDVLDRCDLAKFAGIEPAPEECAALAERMRHFVTETALSPTALSPAAKDAPMASH